MIRQSGIVINFDNLDQNKSLTNRCTSFRSRDIIWYVATVIQYGGRRGAEMRRVTFFTTSQCSYIDLILCLLHNRLLDCRTETDLRKKTVFV